MGKSIGLGFGVVMALLALIALPAYMGVGGVVENVAKASGLVESIHQATEPNQAGL